MNKTTTIILVLIIGSFIYFSTGCKKDNEPETVESIMLVDSIQHLDTIKSGEVFEVLFYGPIGPNNCYSFSRFVPAFGLDAMNFTLYSLETKRDDCEGGEVYLNGQGVGITDMTPGVWSIQVNQPEGNAPILSSVVILE